MSILSKVLISTAIAGSLFLTGFFFSFHRAPTPLTQSFGGTFTPAMIPQTTLSGAGATASQTTIPLVSLATRDGRAVTMSMLGTTGYGTVEPGSSKEEIVSFTGITQNANGTAILTGVQRGLDFISPYNASTTLQKSHAGGASFIISNTSPFYGQQFALVNNPTIIYSLWTFSSTTPPIFDVDPGATYYNTAPAGTLVSLGQLNRTALAGTVNATAVLNGVVQLATALQAASSTVTGSTGANDVLWSKYATDTPQNCTTASPCVPMTSPTGFLRQLWIDFTANFNFTGNTYVKNLNASSTVIINGVTYNFPPSASTASSSIFTVDGANNVYVVAQPITVLYNNTQVNGATTQTSTTTLALVTIPANTLSVGTSLRLNGEWTPGNSTGTCWDDVSIGNGSSTTTIGWIKDAAAPSDYQNVQGIVYATSSSVEISHTFSSSFSSTNGNTTQIYAAKTTFSTASKIFIAFGARTDIGECVFIGGTVEKISG